MKSMAFLLIIMPLVFCAGRLSAQEEGVTASTDLGLQVSSVPEARATLAQSFTFPFLRGQGPLTSGNNLKTVLTAELSPVSLNGIAETTWTPIAFFQLIGGAKTGSGWNINLFGEDIYGIGLNERGGYDAARGAHKSKVDGSAFDGFIWSAWAGGAFQFDLAALFPGDWNHVLFRTYHEARYSAYTRAGTGDSWFFENDYGENQNGWVYNAAFVIGYQMPLSPVLNTVAFMAEMRKNLYNTPGQGYWGGDLPGWMLTGLLNFTVNPRLSAVLAVQFRTFRNNGSSDLTNKGVFFYQDLKLQDSYDKQYLLFYRVAVVLNYRLK
jgi:hypothetical protein